MDATKARESKLTQLDALLAFAEKNYYRTRKRKGETATTSIKWGRLMVTGIVAYGNLLTVHELDQRITELEKQLEKGVLIPHEPKP